MSNTKWSRKELMLLGRTAVMLDAGNTVSEIAATLKLNESTVRTYQGIIDKAEANKKLAK